MIVATKKMWALVIIMSLVQFYGEALEKKRVCVIGAGRAGLAAIKSVADRINDFELIAFERNSDIGGLWLYTDSDLDKHGLPVISVYKNLKTIAPLKWMVYPDYNVFRNENEYETLHQKVFLDYLRNYTSHFNLRKYIKFDTLVTMVSPIEGNGDWRTTTWRMDTRDLVANKSESTICDAVMVCNGRCSKQYIPKIPGMNTFPGKKLHSGSYRSPEAFTNQTVLLLGAGASGTDIARDLNQYAKLIYLSHRHGNATPFERGQHPSNVRLVRGVVAANGNKLTLQDNSTISVDSFIYCTGFLYDFSFLAQESGVSINDNMVCPLYDRVINAIHPSMAFIGLLNDIKFGPTALRESKYFLDVLQDKQPLQNIKKCWEPVNISET